MKWGIQDFESQKKNVFIRNKILNYNIKCINVKKKKKKKSKYNLFDDFKSYKQHNISDLALN